MRQVVVAALAFGGLLVGPAFGQVRSYVVTVAPAGPTRGFQKTSISKATVGSSPIRLWANTAINPDCSAQTPAATLTIISPPNHGQATISDDRYFLSFPPTNPRSACNARKVPGHQAFYTAAAGFTGRDHVVLQGTSPDGRVRQISVDIEVR